MSENTIKVAPATIQQGIAKADGKLSLTLSDLHFEPFNESIGLGPYSIARSAIAQIERCAGKGAGVMPVTKEAIRLILSDGQTFEFILANPQSWLDAFGE